MHSGRADCVEHLLSDTSIRIVHPSKFASAFLGLCFLAFLQFSSPQETGWAHAPSDMRTRDSGQESSSLESRRQGLNKPASGRRFPPIVFVSRNPLNHPATDEIVESRIIVALPGFGPSYRFSKPGGRLLVRESNGEIRTLVDRAIDFGGFSFFDVSGPNVSWDGKRIVFAGAEHPDSNWRIYEINREGKRLRKVTRTDRVLNFSQFGAAAAKFQSYDDIDPCYLPDGRIVFASTRNPAIAELGEVLVTNLYVVNADGADLHRITSERNGAEKPTIDPLTGRVVYARWWLNIDRPSNETREGFTREDGFALTDDIANIWHAMSLNPDGGLLKLYAGFLRTRFGTQTYKPSVMSDGKLLSTFSPQTSLLVSSGGMGIRWFKPGADFEHHIIGVKSFDSMRKVQVASPPYATDPVEYTNKSIICSYSEDGIDYGIYTCRLDGTDLQQIINLPGSLELEPQVLKARPVPPILEDQFPPLVSELPPTEDPETYYVNDSFRFDCLNIFTNGAVDEPMPDAPRIATGAKIRFFLNCQRQNPHSPDPSILLKTVDVFSKGGVHEPGLPADVPLFEQIIDGEGKVLRTSSGGFAHVPGMNYERIGGGTKCAGCHAGHSMLTVPVNGSIAEWFNAAPSAVVTASTLYVDERGTFFPPQRVVDRQAQTGGDSVIWIANEGEGASITLKWEIPIEIRRIVLYGIPTNLPLGTNINVQNCKIILYYNSNEVRTAASGRVSPKGTQVSLPVTKVDSARIVITKVSGMIYKRPLAGLAEVETIARIY